MTFTLLGPAEQSEYSQLVAAHDSGSFLQSWSWGEFQASLGHRVIRVGAKQDGRLVATAQFIVNQTPKLKGDYLYCPYGPLSLTDEPAVINGLLETAKAQLPGIKFMRLEPKQPFSLSGKVTQRIQPGKTLVTDLTQSEDELQQAMHPKTRYNIKVASKHGVTVSATADIDAVVNLLETTARRQNYKTHGARYYRAMMGFFQGHSGDATLTSYLASYNGQNVAGAIMLDHGTTRTYLFGGSDDRHKQVMAPYALHWQAMQDAKRKNLSSYDWWGIETASGQTPGFVEFKKRWGGKTVAYPDCVDLVYESAWYNVYKVLRIINRIF